ncbi:hypothetical protein HanHA300_Chr07g0233891 [Helianthus annuus]|nr:hypothetical protein HanHA300_Chr07g0233891 [Helianthus annuus]KAJ0562410.1 hypothetical protein HanHA89_Chr07g0251061 [Helianthus annuus]KAJ0727785.1 hypothetical protein HanLR1_Chr07g0233821 [Helianthus annuus]
MEVAEKTTGSYSENKKYTMFSQKGGVSNSDMVRNFGGSCSNQKVKKDGENEKVLVIQEETRAFQELHGRALVGKTCDLQTLTRMDHLFKEEGMVGMEIMYIRGLSRMMKFSDKEEASQLLLKPEVWSQWITRLDLWVGQVLSFERVVWLKLHGFLFTLRKTEFSNILSACSALLRIPPSSMQRIMTCQ